MINFKILKTYNETITEFWSPSSVLARGAILKVETDSLASFYLYW